MQPMSLKSMERKAFRATLADGLWDVFAGCLVLELALAPLLSEPLGDFWGAMLFLPFFGLVYALIGWVRRAVVAPRIGTARPGKARQGRLRWFVLGMMGINALALLLGIVVVVLGGQIPGGVAVGGLGALLLVAGSLAAYLLDYPRFYVYALLLFTAPLAGEWLAAVYGLAHHGFPLAFGFASGVMIAAGLVTFVRLVKANPLPEIPAEGA